MIRPTVSLILVLALLASPTTSPLVALVPRFDGLELKVAAFRVECAVLSKNSDLTVGDNAAGLSYRTLLDQLGRRHRDRDTRGQQRQQAQAHQPTPDYA